MRDPPNDNKAAIAAVRARWVQALNDASAPDFVRCITEDAVWLPPRGPAIHGRDAIARWLKPHFAQYRYQYTTRQERVRLAGNWAVEEAHFRTILHPRTAPGDPLIHDGRYLLIWRRLPTGRWLIDRYVDRTPPPATT